MSLSTGRSSIDASGNVFVYQPPNTGVVNRGSNVVNGNYQQITAGNQIDLSGGVWQFANGSGALQATGPITYQVVTIVPGPILQPGPASAPQTVGVTGISAAPSGYVYVPPNATMVAVGSQVSAGPLVTIDNGDVLPNAGLAIIAVHTGAAPAQAMNLVLVRPVTVTPI